MGEDNHTIAPGDRISVSIPGIAQEFPGEIIELQKLDDQRARVCVRSLEPVLAHNSSFQVLYDVGSLIWVTMNPPDGYCFQEMPRPKEMPPLVGYVEGEISQSML